MSIRHLARLHSPGSIALIGASSRQGSVGRVVLRNVLAGGFSGEIFAVNPNPVKEKHVKWVGAVADLPYAPDLAVIMTPAATIVDIVAELGRIGTRVAVVLTAGVDSDSGLRQAMLDAARVHDLRVVGPNCLGVLMPHAKLNASFAHIDAKPGRLALISQSGALVTAILDWAAPRDIGFSGIVSAGDMADVDIGDLIDLFATDPGTDAILLYVEGISEAAKFMSAARAAARNKPVIAIKAGRSQEAARAAKSHSGALAGAYPVYHAAFERAGIVMVEDLSALFDAAEVLCKATPPAGERLAIITNGGGAGVLAIDDLGDIGARLATLDATTIAALDAALPATWSHGNPIDLIGDGGPDRYRAAIKAVLADPNVDGLLVMHCPTAMASPTEIATAVAEEASGQGAKAKPIVACWLGDEVAKGARPILAKANIPLLTAPEDAVRGYGYLLAAKAARTALNESVPPHPRLEPDRAAANAILAAARADGRTLLNEIEAKQLLAAYGITVVPTRFVDSAEEIPDICNGLPAPYAVKIVSRDITHKSDVGGVALDLADATLAMAAATAMGERIQREHPEAKINGFAIESMCVRPHGIELLAGLASDPTFGPVLLFGAGGKAVEVINDTALALPPLDHQQAHALIARTRIAKLLAGYRDQPPADRDAIAEALVSLSRLASDFPDIIELDINPLIADRDGAVALDARVVITKAAAPASRMVIRPVPTEWSADLRTRSGTAIHVRPVVPEDEAALADFFARVTPEDLRFRFLSSLSRVGHEHLAMMTNVDYRRSISFVALDPAGEIVAAALLAADPDRTRAEIAMSTRADWKGRGVSYILLEHLIRYARAQRIETIEAVELASHEEALRMEREMGFTALACLDDPTLRIVRRQLQTPQPA